MFACLLWCGWHASTPALAQGPQDNWVTNGLNIGGRFGAIAVGPDGLIYAATNYATGYGNFRMEAISVFDPSGAYIRQFAHPLGSISSTRQATFYCRLAVQK
jgi:hypothetical protein